MPEKMDLTGKYFGRWTVLYEAEPKHDNKGYNKRMWHCRCKCGNEKDVPQIALTQGSSKSCGCLHKELLLKNKYDSIEGQKFGKWTVLYEIEPITCQKGKRRRWHCKCECGVEKDVEQRLLLNGYSCSCGCTRKEKYKEIGHNNKKYNLYDLSGEYGIGFCTNGRSFYFDLEDYEKIKGYCWTQSSDDDYVKASSDSVTGEHKRITMSRLIMGLCHDDNILVDHRNHNKSDNRKENLRLATSSQNLMNKDILERNTSSVTGVCLDKKRNKWRSYIYVNKKQIHLGYFDNFIDAVRVRREAENKYFGEYSYNNSIKMRR